MFGFYRPKPRVRYFALPVLALVLQTISNVADAKYSKDLCPLLNKFIDPFVEAAMFDGIVMIGANDKTYVCYYGLANYEYGFRHSNDTRYRIASVSKTMTDAAFARLVQQDSISLDDPLSQFVPEFPNAKLITVRHLLTHASGIAHTNSQPWGTGRVSLTLDEIVERLAGTPFEFEPGEDRKYSNGGYALAAKILEIVTEKDYGAAMKTLVFDPLDMKNTGHIDDARALMPQTARGYEPGIVRGSRRHTRFYAVEVRPGGGSLYSTAHDLMAFMNALRAGEFIAPGLLRDIVGSSPEEIFQSQGRSPGFVSTLYDVPDRGVSVVSLSNNYAVPSKWGEAIADIVIDGELSSPWPQLNFSQNQIAPDHAILGNYASNFGVEITIKWSDGAVYFDDAENQLRVGMPLLSDGSFLLPIYFSQCTQAPETRVIRCEMLSGDERYTQIYTPINAN